MKIIKQINLSEYKTYIIGSQSSGYRNVCFVQNKFYRERYYLNFPEIYYCLAYHRVSSGFLARYIGATFLNPQNNKHYLIPLPNIYSNSSICLGELTNQTKHDKNLEDLLSNVASYFWSTKFDIYEFNGICKWFYRKGLFPEFGDSLFSTHSHYLDLWEQNKADLFLGNGFLLEEWLFKLEVGG
jgi:hypothetical protein